MTTQDEKPLFTRKPEEVAEPPPAQTEESEAPSVPPAGAIVEAQPPAESGSTKAKIEATGEILPIIPTSIEDAYRMAKCFVMAGMAPNSYIVKTKERGVDVVNYEATMARVATGIMHGLAVGMAPTVALATIMIINGKAVIFGDGASALVSRSGKAEYIKTEISGAEKGWGPGYTVTVTAKRKDQSVPVVRTFSYEDAKRASLLGKKGPWSSGYAARQCYWRAWSWACRDAFSDALCGLAIAEEIKDLEIEAKRDAVTDTSDLDGPKQIEATHEKPLVDMPEIRNANLITA